MLAIMLALALVSAPEPWPAAQCKSGFGQTACGYDCTSGFGEVRCAQTPYGKCMAAFGKVRCDDPARQVLHIYHGVIPQMECKSGFGDIACGYDCKAAFGEVRCAGAPDGKCEAAYGKVTCWSPAADVRPHDHRADSDYYEPPLPPARVKEKTTCRSAFGQTACGYDCVAAFGTVKCAETPAGACKAAFGEVVCADPPAWSYGRGGRPPKAKCEAAFGKIACGYGCVAAFGDVRCATRPGGSCQAAYGELVCSD